MDSFDLVFYCRYNEDRAPITLHKRMTYADLLHKVCQRFNLILESVFLCYLGVRDERCFLRSDDEMKDMVCLFSVLGTKIVEVIIFVGGIVTYNCGSSIESSSITECSEIADEQECFDDFDSSLVIRNIYKTAEWANLITSVGQVFSGGVNEFRAVLRKYCIYTERLPVFEMNKKNRVIAFCRERSDGCGWSIEASFKLSDNQFMVRKFEAEYTCEKLAPGEPNKHLNNKLISSIMEEYVRENPLIAPAAIVSHLRIAYGLEISYFKAWNALQMANGMHSEDIDGSYNHLERYIERLNTTNPGSCTLFEVAENETGPKILKRFLFSLQGCIEGFKYVSPLLFIDGTFLKGKYKGVLLSAVGKNGNRGLYPLAFVAVDKENAENWEWFLEQVKITIGDDRPITFFSDRHKGLLEGMARIFPTSVHYYCLRHLKENLKLKFSSGDGKKRSDVVNMLGICCMSPTIALFEKNLKELRRIGGRKIDTFIKDLDPRNWAEAYCTSTRYGETTSNAVESFNNWIQDVRELPITEMVDKLRLKLMKWFDERRSKAGVLCPYYEQKWNTLLHNGLSCLVVRSSDWKFEVLSNPSQCVDLVRKECSCHEWKRHGFPCSHEVLCIIKAKLPMKDYVEKWFFADTYRSSYATTINPVPTSIWRDSGLIDDSKIKPPDTSRGPGRPAKKRKQPGCGKAQPGGGKPPTTKQPIQCGRCKKFANHNKRTCKETSLHDCVYVLYLGSYIRDLSSVYIQEI